MSCGSRLDEEVTPLQVSPSYYWLRRTFPATEDHAKGRDETGHALYEGFKRVAI